MAYRIPVSSKVDLSVVEIINYVVPYGVAIPVQIIGDRIPRHYNYCEEYYAALGRVKLFAAEDVD